MKRRIHVNQHVIKANKKHGQHDPPLTVKTYKVNTKAYEVGILDKDGNEVASVIYRPDQPLDSGAHVWIETEHEVRTAT